jgi:hypothetical protein
LRYDEVDPAQHFDGGVAFAKRQDQIAGVDHGRVCHRPAVA